MGEKWPHCYSNKFTEVSKIEINCVILNAIYCKKVNFVHHQLVYTETRRKQPMPNNFRAKFFHSFLKQTVISIYNGENEMEICKIILKFISVTFEVFIFDD